MPKFLNRNTKFIYYITFKIETSCFHEKRNGNSFFDCCLATTSISAINCGTTTVSPTNSNAVETLPLTTGINEFR